jgi:hypothetical protein
MGSLEGRARRCERHPQQDDPRSQAHRGHRWQRIGIAPHLAEIMLGHATPAVRGVYERHRYDDEVRSAFETWGERVSALIR